MSNQSMVFQLDKFVPKSLTQYVIVLLLCLLKNIEIKPQDLNVSLYLLIDAEFVSVYHL